jgi:hypothetical protein
MSRPALLIGVLLLVGCAGNDEPEEWAGPPRANAQGAVAVDGFNEFVEEHDPELARSPLASAETFLRADRTEATRKELVVQSPPEGGRVATVTATLEGLLDDSVRAVRYVLQFARDDDDSWRLRSARWSQRCHLNRGHQELLPKPCI